MNAKQPITNLPLDELKQTLKKIGLPDFRYKQIIKWIYEKRVNSFDEMRNVSNDLKNTLSKTLTTQKLPITSLLESKKGDSVKFGFKVSDDEYIVESLILIDENRRTLCVSSQLGCGLGCVFCQTAKMGFIRNLTQYEILGQLIGANDYLAKKQDKLITNIVFMGMGEALSNFETFLTALDVIMDPDCFGIGGRKITVSTAGVVPSIDKLINADLNIGLAISLNSYNNEKRNKTMPINRRYPIEELIAAAKRYTIKKKQTITFEYIVIENETDTDDAFQAIVKLLKGINCKINLIPLNPGMNENLREPSTQKLSNFAKKLANSGLRVVIRKSRGRDILGACGQLAGKVLKI